MEKKGKVAVKKIDPKYVLIAIFVLIVIVSLFILKPFFIPIIYAIVLSYLFYPIFSWLERHIKRRKLASIITTLIIIFIIFLPFMLIIQGVMYETKTFYTLLNNYSASGSVSLDNIFGRINSFFGTEINLSVILDSARTVIHEKVKEVIFSIPKNLISFFVILILMYSFFMEGNKIIQKTEELINIDQKYSAYIIKSFKDITNTVVYGQVLNGIVQGVLGILAFLIFGIPSPFFWGLIMGIIAIIPFLGAWIIWLPTSLTLIIEGTMTSNTSFIWRGVGLFLFGLLVISLVDNIIKPIIISSKTKIHPVLVVIGVFGGIYSFGFIGVVIGPWVLELLVGFWEIIQNELSKKTNDGA